MLLGKCKINNSDMPCILEWPKSGTPKTLNAGEFVEQQELSQIAGGNAKW